MKKFCIILSCLLITLLIKALPVYAKEFSDVPADHWAHQYISELSDKGIINGYQDGTYKPNNQVTRGEFAKLIMTTLYGEGYFAELTKEKDYFHWADVYYFEAVYKGFIDIMKSYDSRDVYVDRLEMAEFLSKVVQKHEKLTGVANSSDSIDFTDLETLSLKEKGNIIIAVRAGLLNGYDDKTFKPFKEMSRAEVAVIIYRLTNLIK